MRCLHWLWQVLKKWWVWLGLLPLLLDLVSAYIPTDYIPAPIFDLLKVGGNWQLTLVLVTFFLLKSAFLVHSETEDRLAAYEYQAPKYDLETEEVSSEIDPARRHVNVRCKFRMRAITPWEGDLANITVVGENQLKGLGYWKIHYKEYRHSAGYFTVLNLPFAIPQPECDLGVLIRSEISGFVDPGQRKEWENAVIPLSLIIEYFTQPVGRVQKELSLDIKVNLGQEFDSISERPRPPDAPVENHYRTFVG